MNKTEFYHLLQHPAELNASTLVDLRELLRSFPYFQAARLLYLKNLWILEHHDFKKELRIAAVHIPQRKAIYEYLHGSVIAAETNKSAHSLRPKEQQADNSDDNSRQPEKAKLPTLKRERKYHERMRSKLLILVSENEKTGLDYFDQLAGAVNPLNDYLEAFLNDSKPQDNAPPANRESSKSNDLIDRFIELNPSIKPTQKSEQTAPTQPKEPEFSNDSEHESDHFITETLAKIYLAQGHYEKALLAYEKLSLNYPEKSVYFARQIKKIEELKNRSKA